MLQEIERNGKREHRHDSDTLFDAMALEDTKYAVLKTPCAILERDMFSLHCISIKYRNKTCTISVPARQVCRLYL